MPYNIFGEWIEPKPQPSASSAPVKVQLVKRHGRELTLILNLNRPRTEMEKIASSIKKEIGCGGCIKGEQVEIQGDQVVAIQKHLRVRGIA